MPLQEDADQVGQQVLCPRCKAPVMVPAVSDPDVKPLQISATKISKSTYQVVCPCCRTAIRFRESTLGGATKCRNCGFKITLPTSIPSTSRGCMVLVLLLFGGLMSLFLII